MRLPTAIVLLSTLTALGFTTPGNAGLPSPPSDYAPSDYSWSLFVAGDFTLRCRPTGNYARIFGRCVGGDCMCEPGIDQTGSLIEIWKAEEWRLLANTIIYQQEEKTGLHPADFFYVMLANAALNLGYRDAALAYYYKARSARYSCLRYGRPNDGRSCGGATNFKSGWIDYWIQKIEAQIATEQKRAEELARQAEAEARRQAEEDAKRAARAARLERLNSRYPEGWAQKIIQGKIEVGFTKDAVIEALGQPQEVITVSGGAEMWVYRNRRIVFTDGKVSYIEEI